MKSGCWMAFGPYGDAPDGMAGTHLAASSDDIDDEADNGGGRFPRDGLNVVVRKSAVYESLPWGVDLYESLTAVAPFGGPIAVLPSDSSTITIYTSAGKPIRTFPTPRLRVKKAPMQLAGAAFQHSSLIEDIPEEIVVMGWNLEESLIALAISGNVYSFSLSSPDLAGKPELAYGGAPVSIAGGRWGDPEEELSPEDDPFSLCYALVGPSGIVVQDEQFRIKGVLYEERREPARFEVEMFDYIDDDIVAMDVIPRETNYEREHTLIVAPGKKDTKVKGSLLLVNVTDGVVTNLELQIHSGVNNVKRDRGGDFIALTTRDGRLLLTNGNVDRILFSFNLRCPGVRPSSIVWVGPDVVSLQYSRGDVDEFRYDDFSLLVCVNTETHAAALAQKQQQKVLARQQGGSLPPNKGRTRSAISDTHTHTSNNNGSGGGAGRTLSGMSTLYGHDAVGGSGPLSTGIESTVESLSEANHSLLHIINWGTEANGGLCRVVQEVDGMRVLTEEGCYMVEQLPLVTVRTLRHNSQALISRTINAFARFTTHDDIVPLFKVKAQMSKIEAGSGSDCLSRVLDELLDVVVGELDVTLQRLLLQVVSFVIPMVRGYESEKYVDVVKRLRVLNAIRHVNCGIPLTHHQYEELAGTRNLRGIVGPEAQGVVDRLINRQEFQLALEVATLMNIRTQKLFVQWSCAKVLRASGTDAALKRELVSVLSSCPGASFIDAALTAFDVNRRDLAVSLLHEDPRPSNQVMLFLQIGQDMVALQRACESSDADLILMVLVKLLREGKHSEVIDACATVGDCVSVLEELGGVNREWEMLVGEYYRRKGLSSWKGYRVLTQLMLNHTFLSDNEERSAVAGGGVATAANHHDVDDISINDIEGNLSNIDSLSAAAIEEDEEMHATSDSQYQHGDKSKTPPTTTPEVSAIVVHSGTILPSTVAVGPVFKNAEGVDCAYLEGVPGPRHLEGIDYLPASEAKDILSSLEDTANGFGATSTVQTVCKDDCAWLRKHVQLIKDQRHLCDLTDSSRFLNASINRTIQYCVEEGLEDDAQRLKQEYHLKDAVFWHLKLRAYVESERWEDLDTWAGGGVQGQKAKIRSPIGFEPFVEALHTAGRHEQMAHFVRKLNGLVKRVEWFTQIDRFDWAADEAYKEDDLDMLKQILRYAKDDRTANYIQSYIDELA